MQEIKVGLNVKFPGKQKAHTIVREIKNHPPKNINYGWAYPQENNHKNIATHPKTDKFDLLESFDNLFLTKNKWVCMMANAQFALNFKYNDQYFPRKKRINILKKILKKDNCKKIILYSKDGLKSLSYHAKIKDKQILDKTTYVYNAVPQPKPKLIQNKNKEKFRILFIGTAFYLKGGASLVDALEILQKKYSFLELEIHSSLMKKDYLQSEIYQPLNHKKTLHQIKTNPSITYFNSFEVPREKILKEVYPRADLFILPSMQEGCPYVLQEATSYGLPIISTNCVPAIPEIVENKKNGLIIDVQNKLLQKVKNNNKITEEFHNYLTQKIVKNISTLVENKKLRKKIKQNNLKKARKLFSFQKRNKVMREIYEEAIE